ncbi:MAG: pentapeptide repeat-containing protein [Chloroflexi bacterium]|nr:pentapeptide repeat-containing protein [Chloroflexota bacterium]
MAQVNLQGASLKAARLNGVDLKEANLTGADLSEAKFLAVDVAGADFSGANLAGAQARSVVWSRAKVPPAERPSGLWLPWWVLALALGAAVGLAVWFFRRRAVR